MSKNDNVVSLELYKRKQCRHLHFRIDEAMAQVECCSCGEFLDPMAALVRLARQQSVLGRAIEQKKLLDEKLSKRIRCKCEHCGQMTRIRI